MDDQEFYAESGDTQQDDLQDPDHTGGLLGGVGGVGVQPETGGAGLPPPCPLPNTSPLPPSLQPISFI